MVEERLSKLETKVDDFAAEMRTGFQDLKRHHDVLHEQITEFKRHQEVLHEQTIEAIRDLAPDFAPIRREFQNADAELREDIERRLDPHEATARTHSRLLHKHSPDADEAQ